MSSSAFPYLFMTEGKINIENGIAIDISRIDAAFESGRGYYELLASKDNETYILRFNIKSFRNNYSISDLVKMNLSYHAIEVGEFIKDKLSISNEFSFSQHLPSGYELINKTNREPLKQKVFDVIFAGVEK